MMHDFNTLTAPSYAKRYRRVAWQATAATAFLSLLCVQILRLTVLTNLVVIVAASALVLEGGMALWWQHAVSRGGKYLTRFYLLSAIVRSVVGVVGVILASHWASSHHIILPSMAVVVVQWLTMIVVDTVLFSRAERGK